jgi:hypothetical protein
VIFLADRIGTLKLKASSPRGNLKTAQGISTNLMILSFRADQGPRALQMSLFAGLKKHAIIGTAVAFWIPAVGFGINTLVKYSTTPGHPAAPPLDWPRTAPIHRSGSRATLVMFAHPQCGCSRASLGELAIIMAHAQNQLDASVFFYLAPEERSEWARTDLWQTAAAIPGVHVFEDRDAAVARVFGVFTSGQTLLYNSGGLLQFKGGITALRGHSGDNAGRSAITALLLGETLPAKSLPVTTPVFGCSLRGE